MQEFGTKEKQEIKEKLITWFKMSELSDILLIGNVSQFYFCKGAKGFHVFGAIYPQDYKGGLDPFHKLTPETITTKKAKAYMEMIEKGCEHEITEQDTNGKTANHWKHWLRPHHVGLWQNDYMDWHYKKYIE